MSDRLCFSDDTYNQIIAEGRQILENIITDGNGNKLSSFNWNELENPSNMLCINAAVSIYNNINEYGYVDTGKKTGKYTCRDALIVWLYTEYIYHKTANNNILMPHFRRMLKNTSTEKDPIISLELYARLNATNMQRTRVFTKQRDQYTAPELSLLSINQQRAYIFDTIVCSVMLLRLNGDTTNLLPELLELPRDGCI